jgi:hypothetical protein
MRKFSALIILVFFIMDVHHSVAQQDGISAQQNMDALNGVGSNVVSTYDARYKGVRGNPYFLPYWANAALHLKDGRTFMAVPLKYDIHQNQVVVRRQKGDSIIINSSAINHFVINDITIGKEYVFKQFPDLLSDQPRLKETFMRVFHEGRTSFLADNIKTIIKADYKGAYSTGRAYDEWVDETSYYLLLSDRKLVRIKLNKKSIMDSFPAHQAQLKAFAQKENIDFKSESDVGKLVAYVNTLE